MAATAIPTGEEILAIPPGWPERLFTGADSLAVEWRSLAKRFHPDRNIGDPQAESIFKHLGDLHREAVRRAGAGEWRTPGRVEFRSLEGKTFRMAYRRHRTFEIGELWAGRSNVVFAIDRDHADLFENARRTLTSFRYANAAMEEEFSRYVPRLVKTFETASRLVMVVTNTEDLVHLDDLLVHAGGALEPTAAAWVISSLSNLACWLKWNGIAHTAIAPDTIAVSPRFHSVVITGGWFHSVPFGALLPAVPEFTIAHGRPAVGPDKRATPRLDLELVRAVGRAALGDPHGARLVNDPSIPAAMAEWLVFPPPNDAFEDYRSWESAREASFGPRRFVPLDVDVEALLKAREEEN